MHNLLMGNLFNQNLRPDIKKETFIFKQNLSPLTLRKNIKIATSIHIR